MRTTFPTRPPLQQRSKSYRTSLSSFIDCGCELLRSYCRPFSCWSTDIILYRSAKVSRKKRVFEVDAQTLLLQYTANKTGIARGRPVELRCLCLHTPDLTEITTPRGMCCHGKTRERIANRKTKPEPKGKHRGE